MTSFLWIIFGAFVGALIYCLGRLHAWEMAQYHYYNDLPPFDHAKNTDLRAYYRWKEEQNGGKEYGE